MQIIHHISPLRSLLVLLLFVTGMACKRSGNQQANQEADDAQAAIYHKTDSAFIDAFLKREKAFKDEDTLVRKFYAERDYRFAWFKGNDLIPQADKFIEVINENKNKLVTLI